MEENAPPRLVPLPEKARATAGAAYAPCGVCVALFGLQSAIDRVADTERQAQVAEGARTVSPEVARDTRRAHLWSSVAESVYWVSALRERLKSDGRFGSELMKSRPGAMTRGLSALRNLAAHHLAACVEIQWAHTHTAPEDWREREYVVYRGSVEGLEDTWVETAYLVSPQGHHIVCGTRMAEEEAWRDVRAHVAEYRWAVADSLITRGNEDDKRWPAYREVVEGHRVVDVLEEVYAWLATFHQQGQDCLALPSE